MRYCAPAQTQLTDLPAELLAEIYLFGLSPALPLVCKHIYYAVKSFPASIHAQYILQRHELDRYSLFVYHGITYISGARVTHSLRYPICTIHVMEAMLRLVPHILSPDANTDPPWDPSRCDLPKRFFRNVGDFGAAVGPDSEPMPFLRYLYGKSTMKGFPTPSPNSYNGYPLVRAVHAGFAHLVQFLLNHGADPGRRGCMAVKVAIGKKDLGLVKMLIEFEPEIVASGVKRRKRSDRVIVEPFLLDLAVRCDARDIVQYFMQEKGCVPEMKTLKTIQTFRL